MLEFFWKLEVIGDVVAHWKRSRLLRRWSRVRTRHLSQWKNSEDRLSYCVYCKISEQRGRPPTEAKKKLETKTTYFEQKF